MLTLSSPYIFPNIDTPLSNIPYHADVTCIRRLFAENFPCHLAVHHITDALTPVQYTQPHTHTVDEINIIIPNPNDDLEYNIQIGEDIMTLNGHNSIWIPAGVEHSANVVSGNGYYIAIRLP